MTARTPPTAPSMPLAVGAVWRGHQRSGLQSYEVEVRIAGVDDSTGDVCGTLTIKNLLPSLPKVVTFFDGEIIGPQHHSFVTDKWGASEEDDHAHWDKFRRDIYLRGNPVSASAACSAAPSAYASPIATAPSSEYGTDDEESDDDESEDESSGVAKQLRRKRVLEKKRKSFKVPPNVVLMRLKERCFVNDKEGRDLSEASFDGFYYIAVELNPAPDRPQLSISKASPFASSPTTLKTTQSLLSASAPMARRPLSPFLARNDSYASVVRGRSDNIGNLSGHPSSSKPEENAQPRSSEVEGSNTDTIDQPIYSPSLEEFPPPPPSPSSLPSALPFFLTPSFEDTFRARSRSSSSSLHRSVARAGLVASALKINPGADGNRLSTNFYNAKTGYRGPWAHAVMRGFYFTPPHCGSNKHESGNSASSSSNVSEYEDDDSRDTYQELELHYVGDGLGAMLEENEQVEEEKGSKDEYDDWGNLKVLRGVSDMEKVKKDLKRRQLYMRPKASASFTVM